MKKFILIFGVLIVVVAAGVYFALPTNINWEKYVQSTSEEIRERTGLYFSYKDKPVFSMKPAPVMTLNQVRLGNVRGATYPEMMTAMRAEILFDTKSLFLRKIKIKKITLTSPQFYFETLDNGKWNWQTAFLERAGVNSTFGFDSLFLTEGKAEIKHDKYTPVQTWNKINAEMFADSMQGPFSFEGNFGALSSNFGFSLKIEKYSGNESPDFSLRLINTPAEASFVLNGRYGVTDTDRGVLTGSMTFDIRKPQQFFSLMYPQERLPSDIFQPVIGNLKINKSVQARTTELTDILFKYGTSSATGKLTIRSLSPQEASVLQAEKDAHGDDGEEEIVLRDPSKPSETVRLEDAPVNQTKIAQNLLPKVVNGSFVFSTFDADPFFNSLSAITSFIAKQGYFGNTYDSYALDVMFDTMNLKKDAIHQFRTQIRSDPEGLAFDDFSATLPSNAYVSGKATLSLSKNPLLSGKMAIDAPNFKSILGWLGVPLSEEIPQNLLLQMKADANFKLASNGILLQKVKGVLDKIDFSGDLALRPGTRKAISLSANFSDLDFAQYFPIRSKDFIQKREEFARKSIKEKLNSLFQGLGFLSEFDLNCKLTAGALSWGDIKSENIKSDFSVVRGQMKINEMSADKVFASSVSIKGKIEGFGAEPKFTGVNVNINAGQLSSLVQALGISLPQGIAPQDKMRLTSWLSGTTQILDFDTNIEFENSRFSGQGGYKETASNVDWDMDISISHDNFRNFIRLFTDAYRPALANPGALTLKGHVFKNKDQFQMLNMKGQIGDNDFVGFIKMRRQNDKPVVEAEIIGEDLAVLGMIPNFNITDSLSVNPQKIIPDNIWKKDGVLTRLADGISFSKKPLDFSFLGKYEASVSLKTNALFLNSLVLKEFDGIIKLSDGKIGLDIRRALWNKANIGGIFNLTFADYTAAVKGALRLSNINAPAKMFVSDTLNISAVETMVLNLNFVGNGRTADSLMSSLTGKGTLSFEKAQLEHFNIEKLRQDVVKAPQLSSEAIVSAALQGKTELNRFSADIAIKEGILTLQPAYFLYNGQKNTSPFFEYNSLGKSVSASISFPMEIPNLPDVSLSVQKTDKAPAVFKQNIPNIVQSEIKKKGQQAEKALEQEKLKRQKENEEWAKNFQKKLERLEQMDERLTMTSTDLDKKIEVITPIAEKVYQVQRYFIALKKAQETLSSLNKELQTTRDRANKYYKIEDGEVEALEKKIKKEYYDKESEVEASYNTARMIGAKGAVFDAFNEAGEVLRAEIKAQSSNTDLTDIVQNAEDIKPLIKNIKELSDQSEREGIELDELTILAGQAEAELDKIKEIHKKTLKAIDMKNAKIAAEDQAKRQAEEQRKFAEEEAKKAAEVAAAIEKEKQEAELRERQRTIVRKDGIQSTSAAAKAEKKAASESVAVPVQGTTSAGQKTDAKKEGSIIIRRR
ncbi:MAG: AsmA family protein [Alphaproteobacteria bacterium]|nr:AsmA family protein [Alphaproteobacteria bacterium]